MLSIQYRFFIALGLSISVAAATLVLYFSLQKSFMFSSTQKPIARMSRIINESLKKRSGHLIWEELEKDDFIYAGESVRTMENSIAHIELLKEGSVIKIDPESVIVLDILNDNIQLDFLKGSLVIENAKPNQQGDGQIIIKSNGKSQILKGNEINLSKDDKSGLMLESIFKLKSPNASSDILYTDKESELIEFIFESKEELSEVELWVGNKRNTLQQVSKFQNIKKGINKMSADIGPGSYFWKLETSKNKEKLESSLSFFNLKKFMKPLAVFPAPDSEVLKNNDEQITSFIWLNKQSSKNQKIELASDVDFKTIIGQSDWGSLAQWDFNLVKEGTYFWRVSTQLQQRIYVSDIFKFEYLNQENLRLSKIEKIKIELIKPLQEKFLFEKPKFILPILWNPFKGKDIKFDVLIKNKTTNTEKVVSTQKFEFNFETEDPGEYQIEIKGKSSGQLIILPYASKSFIVEYPPIPVAPELLNLPKNQILKSDLRGDLNISWKSVSKVDKYQIEIFREDKIIKTSITKKNTIQFEKLVPGNYNLKIYSVDFLNRKSEKANNYTLIVPNQSDAEAPKLKPIKIR